VPPTPAGQFPSGQLAGGQFTGAPFPGSPGTGGQVAGGPVNGGLLNGGPVNGSQFSASAAGAPAGPGTPGAAAPRWPLVVLAVVLAATVVVAAVLLIGRGGTTAVPGGPGTALITWEPASPTSHSSSFSGTVAGVRLEGTATSPLASELSPGAGGHISLPATLTLVSLSGTLGGQPFTLNLTATTADLVHGPPFTVRISGTYGTEPVNGTLTQTPGNAPSPFEATVGDRHVSGTIPQPDTAARSATATFTVTG
jgi:hypothetical protein